MTTIGSYQVNVQIESTQRQLALLSSATEQDMPTNWTFHWHRLWENTDFECQNIVKLSYGNQIWGLVKYGIYPYPGEPRYIEIEQLEANPISRGSLEKRFIEPVGKWLIWYAIQVGMKFCVTQPGVPLVVLVSLDDAVSYYRDKIQMEYLGTATIAPGEDGFGFRFFHQEAIEFCQKHQSTWGVPESYGT
ncbi:hypothetical protein NIES4071_76130 [Calothrix sp. NIES-4071]|nr:hypothetical protein NIES4071_76130 [Calothrix sp. NIES-4071]BAZ61888.1 hypothetical protein NIES4105_76080 [Calothrix sp. NIES-4105]